MTQSASCTRGRFSGVPTYFRATCREAARGRVFGYAQAGHSLSTSLTYLVPDDVDADEWQKEVDILEVHLAAQDEDGVWDWFKAHYPKCIALVPARRQGQFLNGVFRAWAEGDIDLAVPCP